MLTPEEQWWAIAEADLDIEETLKGNPTMDETLSARVRRLIDLLGDDDLSDEEFLVILSTLLRTMPQVLEILDTHERQLRDEE